jgi:four helix bundle protein
VTTQLEDLNVLQRAEKISDLLWKHVIRWDPFVRDAVGLQMVRAADSIGANIAEAFGRFHYGEKIQFLYYARGSLFETKYWLNRSLSRSLLTDSLARDLSAELTTVAKQLNAFTRDLKNQRYTKSDQPDAIRESGSEYQLDDFHIEPLFSPKELDWFSSNEQESLTINLQSPVSNL